MACVGEEPIALVDHVIDQLLDGGEGKPGREKAFPPFT